MFMATLVEYLSALRMIASHCRLLRRSLLSCVSKHLEADQRAGPLQQPSDQISASLVAHTEATAPEQPGERALHDPPVPSQPLAGVDSTSRNPPRYGASAQRTA